MDLKYVFNTTSFILKYIAFVMIIPCICAVMLKEYNAVIPFISAAATAFIVSIFFKGEQKKGEEFNNINKSETLATVLLSWILFSLLSAMIFLYFGLNPIDALFEGVSGVTTTGATVLSDFSIYPKTMFFWRSFSQWLGGMGILVLFIAILPQFAIAGRQMFFAESPGAGATESKLTPRVRQTAAGLWSIYFALTLIEIFVLIYLGMPIFDSICNSLSTLAGGGFSPNARSIMGYGQVKFIWTIAIFMFIAATNFSLQYKVFIKRKVAALFKDEEYRLYLFMVVIFTLFIALTLYSHHIYDMKKAVESALFQVLSIISTTGFASVDYAQWNLRAKVLLFILYFTGASVGSASGGLKLIRIIFIFKYLKRQISKIYHPNGVYPIKFNRIIVNEDIVKQLVSFVIFYYAIFIITAVLLVLAEQNVTVGVSSAMASLGNVGPGVGGIIGPMGNYSTLSVFSKLIFIFNMLVGRLELIPFLALLHPDFWNFKKTNNLHKIKNM